MKRFRKTTHRFAMLAGLTALAACGDDGMGPTSAAPSSITCDAGNGGITLPAGFCAVVVADLVSNGKPASARHLVVTPSGDVFVAINSPDNVNPPFGIIGLRDTNGDGKADQQSQFSPGLGGSGIAWGNGVLYFGANDRVLRYTLASGAMTPAGDPVVLAQGFPTTGDHISRTVVLNGDSLFVNVGSATNACQTANRIPLSPGIFPCPELGIRAGVWALSTTTVGQSPTVGLRYATGYRNLVALAMNPRDGTLYGAQHGRDMLADNWPSLYTAAVSAELPAEEVVRITKGSNNGWPYCYYDAVAQRKKVLAPEYGGDGQKVTGAQGIDCSSYNQPLAALPAHWAPNGMVFYAGDQFPARYRSGLFVAMHGGHDRAPLPNEGFNVMFVPAGADGRPTGTPEVFAAGFDGGATPLPANAVHRPVGVTVGPDGSLYVSDDKAGRIWRVIYRAP